MARMCHMTALSVTKSWAGEVWQGGCSATKQCLNVSLFSGYVVEEKKLLIVSFLLLFIIPGYVTLWVGAVVFFIYLFYLFYFTKYMNPGSEISSSTVSTLCAFRTGPKSTMSIFVHWDWVLAGSLWYPWTTLYYHAAGNEYSLKWLAPGELSLTKGLSSVCIIHKTQDRKTVLKARAIIGFTLV